MILRFKPNSKAEAEIKRLIEHRDKTEEYARTIVENLTGIKPKGFGYCWFFGISYSWRCSSTGFENLDANEVPGMKFIREHEGIKYFEPNKRQKLGKQIAKTFQSEQRKLRTDCESLKQFGITAYDEDSGRYSAWEIGEDESGVWMALSDGFMKFLEPHPDVMLQSKIPTVQI